MIDEMVMILARANKEEEMKEPPVEMGRVGCTIHCRHLMSHGCSDVITY